MLYNILINQLAFMQNSPNVSIQAACIMNFMQQKVCIKAFQKETVKIEDDLYFWFSHSLIKENLPILFKGDESDAAVSIKVRRWIAELEDSGLIKKHPQPKNIKKSMYSFTEKADLLLMPNMDKNVQVKQNDTYKNVRVTRTKMYELESFDTYKNVRGVLKNNNRVLKKENIEAPTQIFESKSKEKKDSLSLEEKTELDKNVPPPLSLENKRSKENDPDDVTDGGLHRTEERIVKAKRGQAKITVQSLQPIERKGKMTETEIMQGLKITFEHEETKNELIDNLIFYKYIDNRQLFDLFPIDTVFRVYAKWLVTREVTRNENSIYTSKFYTALDWIKTKEIVKEILNKDKDSNNAKSNYNPKYTSRIDEFISSVSH